MPQKNIFFKPTTQLKIFSFSLVPHLWGNRLSGTIPDEVFKSPKWERWKTQISRQEKGYGYSNYPPEEDEH